MIFTTLKIIFKRPWGILPWEEWLSIPTIKIKGFIKCKSDIETYKRQQRRLMSSMLLESLENFVWFYAIDQFQICRLHFACGWSKSCCQCSFSELDEGLHNWVSRTASLRQVWMCNYKITITQDNSDWIRQSMPWYKRWLSITCQPWTVMAFSYGFIQCN